MTVTIHHGNNLNILPTLLDDTFDAIITDPPYELGFMGKKWDASGIAYNVELWRQCLRVLKPGGYLLAFGGTRTYHRMAVAIEDAGFEIRDSIHWIYGSGFPKSHDVSKAIDKTLGAERTKVRVDAADVRNPKSINGGIGIEGGDRPWIQKALEVGYHEKDSDEPASPEAKQWEGWGTALKPAHEPIVMARKPLPDTVANNVLTYRTGALNIDACRIQREPGDTSQAGHRTATFGTQNTTSGGDGSGGWEQNDLGRWPANIIFDPEAAYELGSEARYFYCAKPSKTERNAGIGEGRDPNAPAIDRNFHPTVKPLALMRYLIRLVTPPNGHILDPFAGSGTTLTAATLEGFHSTGIELTDDYIPTIKARTQWAAEQQPTLL